MNRIRPPNIGRLFHINATFVFGVKVRYHNSFGGLNVRKCWIFRHTMRLEGNNKRTVHQKKRDAILHAYDAHAREVLRYVIVKTGDEEIAKDIVSETFLKTWKYVQANDVKNVRAFLYRTATNLVIDYYRIKPRNTPLLEDMPFESDHSRVTLEEAVDTRVAFEKARAAIQCLPKDYREIFTLRFVQGLELKEIKEITGKSMANIYVILHRGTKALRKELGHE